MGFAQCKTGNSWDKHLTQLNPRTFCRDFMKQPLVLEPVRIYMVPNRISMQVESLIRATEEFCSIAAEYFSTLTQWTLKCFSMCESG